MVVATQPYTHPYNVATLLTSINPFLFMWGNIHLPLAICWASYEGSTYVYYPGSNDLTPASHDPLVARDQGPLS